jgi:hypothetical protein
MGSDLYYVSHRDDHSGKELIDVFGNEEIDFDERNWFIKTLLEVDAGKIPPEELGEPVEDEPGLYVYESFNGAAWPGGFGIWAAFGYDEDGVLVVLVAKKFSVSDVERGVLLNASKRRKQEGTRETGEELEL